MACFQCQNSNVHTQFWWGRSETLWGRSVSLWGRSVTWWGRPITLWGWSVSLWGRSVTWWGQPVNSWVRLWPLSSYLWKKAGEEPGNEAIISRRAGVRLLVLWCLVARAAAHGYVASQFQWTFEPLPRGNRIMAELWTLSDLNGPYLKATS